MAERGKGRIFQPKGRKVWMLAYYGPRPDGTHGEIRESAKTSDREPALKVLEKRLRAVVNHRDGVKEFDGLRGQRILISELLDSLLKDLEVRQIKSLEQVRHAITPVRAFFGEMRAVRVKPDTVRAFIQQRRGAGRRNATINRGLELLRTAFTLAVRGKILAAYAVPEIPRLPEQNARQGFFERTELEALLPHLPSPMDDVARIAYRTGWRRGELLGLRWEWVDLTAPAIRLPDSKNGKPRSVPLDSELAALMARLRVAREYATAAGAGLSAYVFHRNGKPINKTVFGKQWRRACVKAGLGIYERVTKGGVIRREYRGKIFHDFRRTAARNFIRSGVSQEVAKKITGHRTDSTFSRYNITDERDKLNALDAARAYVESLPATESNVVEFRR